MRSASGSPCCRRTSTSSSRPQYPSPLTAPSDRPSAAKRRRGPFTGGDRKSEASHDFQIVGAKQDWKANQTFSYPDGVKATARGRSHVGGTSQWNIQNLAPGRDVVIAKRIDFVRGDIVTRIEIDGALVTTAEGIVVRKAPGHDALRGV